MMKYKLIKKWHPSQVEEVGHVFEDTSNVIRYDYTIDEQLGKSGTIHPHEIALLVDAGYLEKEKIENKYMDFLIEIDPTLKPDEWKIKKGGITCLSPDSNFLPPDLTLDLWTEEPPEEVGYWYVSDMGTIDIAQCEDEGTNLFRLKTNNCHKTQQSAEEALKRLMS